MPENRVVVVAGPTASGKSQMAIDLALALNGVVINADSMQVYKDMPIVSAVPTAEDRAKADHRLFEIYDPSFRGNVVDWLERATQEIKNVWREKKTPIVAGGTGFYIDGLINGATPIPETPKKIREDVQKIIDEKGELFLFEELKKVDPVSAQKLNQKDVSRVKRAYEVFLDTNIPISEWHKKQLIQYLPEAKYFVIKICPSVQELDERSFKRFDQMVEAGVVGEIEALYQRGLDQNLPAMKALGVPEIIEYIKGKTNLYTAVQNAKLHTRQYAKRQRTWFKNKLKADFVFPTCYKGDFPLEIIKILKGE